MKSDCHNLQPGTFIRGKWHNHRYLIKRKLGSGAVGSVYLCELNGREVALKISDQGTSMTVEVNVLKALNKVQDTRLGPYLLDVDDWEISRGGVYTFYVMEYLQGESMFAFIRKYGREWITVFMLQLLDDLEKLHQSGWVFGDFKTDNLLVVHSPPRVRWIDVGGTTKIGRSIKEYTEFYDRGYWGLGSRRAEPSYDLFALVMVFLHLFYPNYFKKGAVPEQTLFAKIDQVPYLQRFSACLKKAILGEYKSSIAMKHALTKELYQLQKGRRLNRVKKRSSVPTLVEVSGLSFLVIAYYLFSLVIQ